MLTQLMRSGEVCPNDELSRKMNDSLRKFQRRTSMGR